MAKKEGKEKNQEELKTECPDVYEFLKLLDIDDWYVKRDDDGTLRFVPDVLVRYIHDGCIRGREGKFNLEHFWDMAGQLLPYIYLVRYYINIGYDIGGFLEIWGWAIDRVLGITRDEETGDETSRERPGWGAIRFMINRSGPIEF